MATIEKFGHLNQENERHTEPCEARLVCLDLGGEKFIQLNTYGTPNRQNVGARSQNMRLSKAAFLELVEAGRKHFDLGN